MIGARVDARGEADSRWDAALDLQLERQNGLNWCWAAVAKGIVEYYGGPSWRQCDYATRFLRQTISCCGAETTPRCDLAYPVDEVLRHHGVYAPPPFRRPIGLDAIRHELERDRPVVALMRFPATVHALAITAVDIAGRRIGFADPLLGAGRASLDAEAFATAYEGAGRWIYTIRTRPWDELASRGGLSFLRERLADADGAAPGVPAGDSAPMELAIYRADLAQLADGNGLFAAEPCGELSFPLDAAENDGSTRLACALGMLREEVLERLACGYEARLLQCFAIKLTALWFVRPGEIVPRGGHFLPVQPVPYYLEAGREYGAAELAAILVEPARICLPSAAINEAFLARLDRETALQPDP